MDRSDIVELVERGAGRRVFSYDDDASLMRLGVLADTPDSAVIRAAQTLKAKNRPVTLESLTGAVLKPGPGVRRATMNPTGRLLGTVGTPADRLGAADPDQC